MHNAPDLVLLKKKNRKTTIKQNYSWRRDRQLITFNGTPDKNRWTQFRSNFIWENYVNISRWKRLAGRWIINLEILWTGACSLTCRLVAGHSATKYCYPFSGWQLRPRLFGPDPFVSKADWMKWNCSSCARLLSVIANMSMFIVQIRERTLHIHNLHVHFR